MPLDDQAFIDLIAIEIKRDPEFKTYFELAVQRVRQEHPALQLATLDTLLRTPVGSAGPFAKVVLDLFHDQSILPQWLRARSAG